MANVVKLKRGSGSDPSASDMVVGEPVIRTDTAELFFKKDDGSVAKVSGGGGGPDFKYLALRNAANNGAASFPGNDFTLVTSGTTNAITPAAANTLLVSVNGVIQKPNTGTSTSGITGFIVDGSRFKTATNLSAAPDFILYQESGGIGEPSDNTVSEAKLNVSNSPVNGYFLSAQSGNTGGLTWAAPIATSCTGNSATATALATARAINGVNFDGTAAITVTAAAGTLSGNTLNSSVVTSSLTSLGDLTSLTVTGDLVVDTSTLKVDSANNRVGVGTASPSRPLDVSGSMRISADAVIEWGGVSTSISGSSGANSLFFRTGDAERMRLNNTGLGIGTTSPAGKLHISSGTSGDCELIIEADTDNNNENDNPRLLFRQDGGVDASCFEQVNNKLTISNSASGGGILFKTGSGAGYTNATERLSIDKDGIVNVVGNLDVGAGIDVTGNISVTGTVDGRDLATDGTKLDGIEASATADQTASEILTLIKTVDGAGSGLDADLLDGLSVASFYREISSASATVGPGWVTVAENTSNRRHGEIFVSDSDSSDHSFIRIDWMRSYTDSCFTVINCGGHNNRITGVRVLRDSDITYGNKKLQVYVTVSSTYRVAIKEFQNQSGWTGHTVVTPVVQASISGYVTQGQVMESLDTYNFAAEDGIQAGTGGIKSNGNVDVTGNIAVSGTVDGRDLSTDGTKLDGIEASATADQTASEILTLIKTVDGSGSGLDADRLDGLDSLDFLRQDGDTANGDITFNGGASAVTIAGGSDIRFADGSWTGDGSAKLQHHSTFLYMQGGSGGIIFRDDGGSNRWIIDSGGTFRPSPDSTHDIGTNSVRVRNIYADTYYGDGSNLTGLSASDNTKLPLTGGTLTGELQVNARLDVGNGGNDHEIRIYKGDNNVADHIQFYNGTTRVGEIGCQDTTWLRINQSTAKNIYTPRYIRADNGFHVDGTEVITGSAKLGTTVMYSARSASTNGYVRYRDGTQIVWGNVNLSNTGWTTKSFAASFPSACRAVIICPNDSNVAGTAQRNPQVRSVGTSSFQGHNGQNTNPANHFFIAVGY